MKLWEPKIRRGSKLLIEAALILIIVLSAWFAFRPHADQRRAIASIHSNVTDPLKAQYRRPDSIRYPKTNPYSQEKYHLGRLLFFDPRLSRSNSMACATCHNPSFSWGNGLPLAVGHGHKILGRKAPTLLNLAWGSSFFWDGRAKTLEEQALGPIQAEGEMNLPIAELITRLEAIPGYRYYFAKAFPNQPISGETIAMAIATFERTIVSNPAPFDRWISGQANALNESAQRGFELFNKKAGCVKCHTGWRFTNDSFADIGLDTEDLGRYLIETDNEDVQFSFKTPTLRNISVRGPYMHDGSIATLSEVIEHYNRGGAIRRKTTRLFLEPLDLSEQEKQDLLAFLESLTSVDEVMTIPSLPLSQ